MILGQKNLAEILSYLFLFGDDKQGKKLEEIKSKTYIINLRV